MEKLISIALKYQSKLEAYAKEPYGTCYISGPCIANYLNSIGIPARDVTGTLILRDKHGKEIIYGKGQLSNKNIGKYHTWCEATIEGKTYVVDASLKYNKIYLRKHQLKPIKISKQVPDVLVTDMNETYYWKFKEDISLESLSKAFLRKCSPNLIDYLSQLDS